MDFEWLKSAAAGTHTVGTRRLPPRTVEFGAAKAQSPELAAQIPMRGGLPARQPSVGQTSRSLERYSPLVPPGNAGITIPPAFVNRESTLSGVGPQSIRMQLDQWGRPQIVPAEPMHPVTREPFYTSAAEEPTMVDMKFGSTRLKDLLEKVSGWGTTSLLETGLEGLFEKIAITPWLGRAGVVTGRPGISKAAPSRGLPTPETMGGMFQAGQVRKPSSMGDFATLGVPEGQAWNTIQARHEPTLDKVPAFVPHMKPDVGDTGLRFSSMKPIAPMQPGQQPMLKRPSGVGFHEAPTGVRTTQHEPSLSMHADLPSSSRGPLPSAMRMAEPSLGRADTQRAPMPEPSLGRADTQRAPMPASPTTPTRQIPLAQQGPAGMSTAEHTPVHRPHGGELTPPPASQGRGYSEKHPVPDRENTLKTTPLGEPSMNHPPTVDREGTPLSQSPMAGIGPSASRDLQNEARIHRENEEFLDREWARKSPEQHAHVDAVYAALQRAPLPPLGGYQGAQAAAASAPRSQQPQGWMQRLKSRFAA